MSALGLHRVLSWAYIVVHRLYDQEMGCDPKIRWSMLLGIL